MVLHAPDPDEHLIKVAICFLAGAAGRSRFEVTVSAAALWQSSKHMLQSDRWHSHGVAQRGHLPDH
jgi:hypothetical protein